MTSAVDAVNSIEKFTTVNTVYTRRYILLRCRNAIAINDENLRNFAIFQFSLSRPMTLAVDAVNFTTKLIITVNVAYLVD